jgi:DDE superfamily endonuclease
MELTLPFLLLLHEFRPVFTRPSFRLFVHLITGWALSCRHRYITECIFSSGHVGDGHWSRYHRFFSHAAWCLDTLCRFLARLLVATFAPTGIIVLAGDDTLCRKRGLTLYGAGMHHDPLISSRALKLVSWGHDWVVLALLIPLPRWAPTKVFALSLGFRLYKNRQGLTKGKKKLPPGDKGKVRNDACRKKSRRPADPNHRTRPELLVELITLFAAWFPEREILVTADSAYGGKSVLQKLPANVHLISHAHPKAALYAPAPPPSSQKQGRKRKKGERLPGMAEWAEDAKRPWQTLKFDQFGLHATLQVKVMKALYYKAGKDRLLKLVLTRDTSGKRPDALFYCTLLSWDARTILSTYACRWALEVTFESSKQFLGLEDPANRLAKAVQRTAPMALVLHSLVVLWFERGGWELLSFPERPWYRRKKEPSFADMLTALRRESWLEKLAQLARRGSRQEKQVAELAELASRVG